MKIDQSVHNYLNDNKLLPTGGHSLKVSVVGGGCSGMRYVFDIIKVDWEKDDLIALDMFVVTDRKSSLFLKDCTLLYKQELGASMLVVENPNAKSTCGCGESFSL